MSSQRSKSKDNCINITKKSMEGGQAKRKLKKKKVCAQEGNENFKKNYYIDSTKSSTQIFAEINKSIIKYLWKYTNNSMSIFQKQIGKK